MREKNEMHWSFLATMTLNISIVSLREAYCQVRVCLLYPKATEIRYAF